MEVFAIFAGLVAVGLVLYVLDAIVSAAKAVERACNHYVKRNP